MLMMNAPRSTGTGDWGVVNWAPQDFKAHINFMKAFTGRLKAAGELVGAEGLATPGQAKLFFTALATFCVVRIRADAPSVERSSMLSAGSLVITSV